VKRVIVVHARGKKVEKTRAYAPTRRDAHVQKYPTLLSANESATRARYFSFFLFLPTLRQGSQDASLHLRAADALYHNNLYFGPDGRPWAALSRQMFPLVLSERKSHRIGEDRASNMPRSKKTNRRIDELYRHV